MSVRRLAVVLAALATAAGFTASSVLGAPAQAQSTTVKVTAFDLSFKLSTKRAKAGKVTFMVTNTGSLKHDFWIAGKKTPLLAQGQDRDDHRHDQEGQERLQVHRRGPCGRAA